MGKNETDNSLWKPGNVGKTARERQREHRKAVPVPDQKGEEVGGTKLQPPGGTTERGSERYGERRGGRVRPWWEKRQNISKENTSLTGRV